MPRCDPVNRPHVTHAPVEVHRHDAFCFSGDSRFDQAGVEVATFPFTVHEAGNPSSLQDRRRGRHERQRRSDHLIPRLDAESQKCNVRSPGPTGAGNGISAPQKV